MIGTLSITSPNRELTKWNVREPVREFTRVVGVSAFRVNSLTSFWRRRCVRMRVLNSRSMLDQGSIKLPLMCSQHALMAGDFSRMTDVTQILEAIGRGEEYASEQLLPIIYNALRKLAVSKLAQEPPGQTLQATDLVHEAYVRLVDSEDEQKWKHRGHFFAAAAEAMRRILVDQARRKQRVKHGGEHFRVELDDERLVCSLPSDEIVELDEALEQFAQEEPEKAQLVKLRFFAGLSIEEAAESLGISRATASRHWTYARAWLHDAISAK